MICISVRLYMLCTRTAASVAMVIYAHSPRLNKCPHGGSHQDLLETKNSVMELQFTVTPKTTIVIQYIMLRMPCERLQIVSSQVAAEHSNVDAL